MPPRSTGSIHEHHWADGRTVTYGLRFRALGNRWLIKLGTNHEGWGPERARTELDRVLDRVERGTWQPPARVADAPAAHETFQVFASRWWAGKQPTLSPKGIVDYEWRLKHLLAHFARIRMCDLGAADVDRYRAKKLKERADPPKRRDGEPLRKPLGNRSINMTLELLAQILDDAVEYKLLDANPARGKKRRLKAAPASKSFLEADMVIALLDAAGALEQEAPPHQRYGRRAILATLCLAGPRVEELTQAKRSRLDIHGGRIQLGLKTEAGIDRYVELTAMLQGELRAHLAAMTLLGRPAGRTAPLFPTNRGGHQNPSNLRNRCLAEAVEVANERRAKDDLPLLPHITPHSLRRTFATLSFAAGRNPRFVMAQMGHTDARLTMSLYAQILDRQHVDEQLIWSLMRFAHEPERPGQATPRATTARSQITPPRRREPHA